MPRISSSGRRHETGARMGALPMVCPSRLACRRVYGLPAGPLGKSVMTTAPYFTHGPARPVPPHTRFPFFAHRSLADVVRAP